MRVLILGATGAAGVLLIQEALAASHTVVVYARSPDKLSEDIRYDPRVTIHKGELDDREALSSAIMSVDAVLSALGPSVSRGPMHPKGTPLARAYSLIIELMIGHHVHRLLALGTPSITDPNDKFSLRMSIIVNGVATLARTAYEDVVAIGETIRTQGNDLDWTIVRVPLLSGANDKNVVVGYVGDGKTGIWVTRAGFASFVVQELEKNEWVKKAPLITLP
ncbi:NAD-P-binding protein [Suillus discolor]|uniref:NAD-P-binding protein n=1 Tax=Suillus discolor TaxID=1912936 RepID=A0A9P7F978_9AGAM|nr:NAD-P-binding protein [Suillus discolor]KAG2109635.1 NAD-P-binding protein [Suillus discolor]